MVRIAKYQHKLLEILYNLAIKNKPFHREKSYNMYSQKSSSYNLYINSQILKSVCVALDLPF